MCQSNYEVYHQEDEIAERGRERERARGRERERERER